MTPLIKQAEQLIENRKFKELLLGSPTFEWVDKLWGPGHSKGNAMAFLLHFLRDNEKNESLMLAFNSFIRDFMNDESIDKVTNSYNWVLMLRIYVNRANELNFWPVSQEKIAEYIINKVKSYPIEILTQNKVIKELDYVHQFIKLPDWKNVFTTEQFDNLMKPGNV